MGFFYRLVYLIRIRILSATRAVEPLIAELNDSGGMARALAIKALGRIGDIRAVAPLIAALTDSNYDIRRAAAEALDQLAWKPPADSIGATYWIAKQNWTRCVEVGSEAVEPLIAVLKDNDWYYAQRAAEALGRIGDKRAVASLITALTDSNNDVRVATANALGLIGDARAVEPLTAALKDNHDDIRKVAAEALGRIGDKRAVASLITALTDSNNDVRVATANALGLIGDARAVEPLIANLKDSNWVVRKTVGENLIRIGSPAVEPFIAVLKDSNRDSNDDIRKMAAEALGRIGDIRAVAPLIAALTDSNYDIRRAAAEALDQLAWKPPSDAIGAAYWIVKREWNRCSEVGAEAVGPLIAELKADSLGSKRAAVATALKKIFESGDLGEKEKQVIMSLDGFVIKPHEDRHSDGHYDEDPYCASVGTYPHADGHNDSHSDSPENRFHL